MHGPAGSLPAAPSMRAGIPLPAPGMRVFCSPALSHEGSCAGGGRAGVLRCLQAQMSALPSPGRAAQSRACWARRSRSRTLHAVQRRNGSRTGRNVYTCKRSPFSHKTAYGSGLQSAVRAALARWAAAPLLHHLGRVTRRAESKGTVGPTPPSQGCFPARVCCVWLQALPRLVLDACRSFRSSV